MSKFQIRGPLLITTALALVPVLAFAAEPTQKHTTTTTTTTTSPQGTAPATAPGMQGNTDQQGSAIFSPSTPPDMTEADATRMNHMGNNPDAIDPAQVQKVFGMDVALIDLKTLNKDQVKQLQQKLHERGFYRGKIDGTMGPQTRNALTGLMAQQYALNQRLVNQGQITEQLATSIGVDTRGRIPATGVDLNDQPGQHPAPPANAQQYPAPPANPQGTKQPIPPNQ